MRVVVHWPRFGPLHLNRMRAAHAVLARAGWEAIALEIASDDAVYDWREERAPTAYARETLFPGQSYDDVAPRVLDRSVRRALDRLDPDAVLIHSYSTPDARAALSWCRRRRRVAVCMAESKASDAVRVGWREAVKRILVAQFDAAQASGAPGARYHASLGVPADRIFVGYSVVDNAYFADEAARVRAAPEASRHLPGLADRSPFFFASARFIPRKDLPTLVRAYADYRARAVAAGADPWRLVLLGDGPLRPEVERALAERAVGGVTLAGWQQIDTLPAYYALASAFVHTATVDQWGLVVNEAMAAGLPVLVSTGAGCHEDLVREGVNGFTFAPGDAAALAGRMYQTAHEEDLASLAEGSLEVVAEFPLERFGTSLLAAVRAGRESARLHGPHPAAEALTWALCTLARSPRSFHSVES
ncbi:MAG TPA: glycosyltransferase family 4 protein [Rubricoccaceae bacterium]